INLALDLSWHWDHSADELWKDLDKSLWEQSHNPWVVFKTVSHKQLKVFLSNKETQDKILALKEKKQSLNRNWFQENHAKESLNCVAYFCMEFMLSEALPIYSGGLGNVAGDQL